MRLLTLSKPSGQADGGSYSRYWAQHLSQHVVNTCFPVSTLAVLTPIFVSQQLPLKADLCTNVHPQALYAKVVCEAFDCGRRAQQLSVTSAECTYISPACRGCATHACEMAAPKPAGMQQEGY